MNVAIEYSERFFSDLCMGKPLYLNKDLIVRDIRNIILKSFELIKNCDIPSNTNTVFLDCELKEKLQCVGDEIQSILMILKNCYLDQNVMYILKEVNDHNLKINKLVTECFYKHVKSCGFDII
jgi:chromosome condensin MukBEF complex kleisin-like MukF subunit